MKTLRITLVALLIITSSAFVVSTAQAGQLSSPAGASISWDDSTFYVPTGCTGYSFNYTASAQVLIGNIEITNMYNDKIGSAVFFGPNSGKTSVQVCTGNDLTGTKVVLRLTGSASYAGSDDIVSTPITFLARSGTPTPAKSALPAPAPTVTVTATPVPAPTVTVTATPAPAATVYITNPANQTLTDLVTSLKGQVGLLNAKIKKICSAKPKPKGC